MRLEALHDVLNAAREAFGNHAHDPCAVASLQRIHTALATPAEGCGLASVRLPVCGHLAAAADPQRFADLSLRRLAAAFLGLEPLLAWRRSSGEAPGASASFAEGHANAMIVGPGGFEPRQDAWLGVSLLAPGVRYPDHTHPPEETYLVLSPGAFSQGNGPWFEPGVGGSFHNPPGVLHAMRAADAPLFAFWALWAG